jgi:hypothetical protein
MNEIIESVKNLSIGFNSQKGKQISILRNVSTQYKKRRDCRDCRGVGF